MHASCDVKHSAYVNISRAPLQRSHKVPLLPKGTATSCRWSSNYSGCEHNDQSDFTKREDDVLFKLHAKASRAHEAADATK
jgi:hypothetical protein